MGESRWDSPGGCIHECNSNSNLGDAGPKSPSSAPGKLMSLPMTPKTSNSSSPRQDLELPILAKDRNVRDIPCDITTSAKEVDDSVNSSLLSYNSQDDPNVLTLNTSNDVEIGRQSDQSHSFSEIVSDSSDDDEKNGSFQEEKKLDDDDEISSSDEEDDDEAASSGGSSNESSRGIVDQTSSDYEDDVRKHEISFDSHSTMEQQGEEYTINDLEEVLTKYASDTSDKKDDDSDNNIDELRIVLFQGEGEEDNALSLLKEKEGSKQVRNDVDDDDWSEELLQPIIEDDESVTGIVLDHLWGYLEPPKKPIQDAAAKMKYAIKKEDDSLCGVVLDHLWGYLEPPKKLLRNGTSKNQHAILKPTTLFVLEECPQDSEHCDRDAGDKNPSVDEVQDDLGNLKEENKPLNPDVRPTSPLGEASLLDDVEAVDEEVAVPFVEDVTPSLSPPRCRNSHRERENHQGAESPKYTSFREVSDDDSNSDLAWICGCDGVDAVQLLKAEDFEALPYTDSGSTASSTTSSPESPSSSKGGDQTLSTCGESSIEEEDSELDISVATTNSTPKKNNTESVHRQHHQAYVRRLV